VSCNFVTVMRLLFHMHSVAHAWSKSACNVLLTHYKSPVADRAHAHYADGHEMVTLNATKLLLLTNQPKLTLTITLTLTDTVHCSIFMRISLTPIIMLCRINESNLSWRHKAGFVGRPIFFPFADVAVLRSKHQRQEVDSSYFITERVLSGVYIRKRG